MKRSVGIVLLAGVVAIGVGVLAYICTMRLCARQTAGDDLAWLKREFRLDDKEMQRIRQLHEGYLPKCRENCAKMAAKQDEVEKALASGQSAEPQLVELGTLRAQCQAQMLKHFEEVSHAMAPDQGKRYLAEMQRLTLGFHQNFENSMGDKDAAGHAHGEH
jgi:hypothetical protein